MSSAPLYPALATSLSQSFCFTLNQKNTKHLTKNLESNYFKRCVQSPLQTLSLRVTLYTVLYTRSRST